MEPVTAHIDVETYSEADLPKVGLTAYANHPTTQIELVSWAVGHGDVKTWDATDGSEFPDDLYALLTDPDVLLMAFNAPFEKTLISTCWGIDIPYERWHCVMVHAYMMGFSGGLDAVGQQIGVPQNKQKLKEGKKLVLKFCKPAGRNHKADRYDRHNAPDDWAKYKTYNIQDVVAEREIDTLLADYPTPEVERRIWLLDRKINERGLPIDTRLVDNAVKINADEIARLKKEMNAITGLANANSTQQLLPWVKFHGVDMPNMQKATVERFLKKQLPERVAMVLRMRKQCAQTSTAKYAKVQGAVYEGRLHNVFQFAGAQRTQRWAGRLVQPHNLKQGYKDADERAELLATTDQRDLIALIEGDVMTYLSNVMRTTITAPKGKKIAVNDYSSVESRILGWVSGCERINSCFASGRDTYKDFAVEFFGVIYDLVTSEQRKFSKPPVLGCGYQLSGETLVDYARGMGVTLSLQDANQMVELWRALHPEVVNMWSWLLETCKRVTQDGVTREGYACRFRRDQKYLFIDLPSGRFIAYYSPAVVPMVPPWEVKKQKQFEAAGEHYVPKTIPTMSYMGMNQYTNKWERISTHGGKITENIVQGIARDILRDDMLELDSIEDIEFDLIGHVHDEALDECDEDEAERILREMQRVMSTTPEWAPSLLLDSEGFITQRYKKG